MLKLSDCLTLALPFVAILVSIATAYVNSRHRSIDLALKYSSLLEATEKNDAMSPFERAVNLESKRARAYYAWKGLSKLTDHKRSYFNYASFLVYAFGWSGMGLSNALKTGAESGEVSGVFLLGCAAMFIASMFMAYCRYDSTLYAKYLDLDENDRYLPSYIAVQQARSKVLDESIVPVTVSFVAGAFFVLFFNQSIANIIWSGVILVCVIGNNVQIVRNERKKEDSKAGDGDDIGGSGNLEKKEK